MVSSPSESSTFTWNEAACFLAGFLSLVVSLSLMAVVSLLLIEAVRGVKSKSTSLTYFFTLVEEPCLDKVLGVLKFERDSGVVLKQPFIKLFFGGLGSKTKVEFFFTRPDLDDDKEVPFLLA